MLIKEKIKKVRKEIKEKIKDIEDDYDSSYEELDDAFWSMDTGEMSSYLYIKELKAKLRTLINLRKEGSHPKRLKNGK